MSKNTRKTAPTIVDDVYNWIFMNCDFLVLAAMMHPTLFDQLVVDLGYISYWVDMIQQSWIHKLQN